MDISTASSLSLYSYQTALQNAQASGASSSSAQNTAVLQALSSAYSADSDGSGDPLADAAGASSLGSLVSGIYSAAAAGGAAANPVSALSSSLAATLGATDASTDSGVLSSLGTDGLQGFSSQALSMNTALAATAYTVAQDGLPSGNLTAEATVLAAGIDPTQTTSVQSAIQAATASSNTSALNLLG